MKILWKDFISILYTDTIKVFMGGGENPLVFLIINLGGKYCFHERFSGKGFLYPLFR